MASTHQNTKFAMDVLSSTSVLDSAVDWVQTFMNPEDVFTEEQLTTWAEENGYVKAEEE